MIDTTPIEIVSTWPRVTADILSWGLSDLVQGVEFMKPWHRRRGRLVHEAAHVLARGHEIEPEWWDGVSGDASCKDENDINYPVHHEQCRGYVLGVEKAIAELEIEVVETEKHCWSRLDRFQGHADWVGRTRMGNMGPACDWAIDLKCGQPPPTGSVMDCMHRLQLAGYKLALAEMYHWILRRAALYLPGDGTYHLVTYNEPRDMAAFQILTRAFWLRRDLRGGQV